MRDRIDSSATAVAGWWRRCWFAPMRASSFALFRCGLGVLSFVWFATLVPDLDAFLGRNGVAPDPVEGRPPFSVFSLDASDTTLWIVAIAGLVASAAMIAGRGTRLAGPTVAVSITSVMGETWLLWNAGDEVLQTFAVLFALYCVLTPSADLDVPLRSSLRDRQALTTGRVWLFRLIQVQMTLIYLATFLEKTAGDSWRDGTAVMTVLRLETMQRFPVPEIFTTNVYFGNALTWGTLLLEGLLPVLLWNRRTRLAAVAAAAGFHLAIDWSLAVGLFSWAMMLGLVTFVDADAAQNATRSIGRRFAGAVPTLRRQVS